MPTFTIFAGVNGCGKTTLYNYENSKIFGNHFGKRVNPDEILKNFGGDWQNEIDVYKSGLIAVNKLKDYLNNLESFNWETTLISNTLLKCLKQAKSSGYKVNLYFISVDNVEIALNRINNRVQKGGHGIPTKIVTSRFEHRFIRLNEALKYIDNAIFYDNSTTLKIVATYTNKEFTYINNKVNWAMNLSNIEIEK